MWYVKHPIASSEATQTFCAFGQALTSRKNRAGYPPKDPADYGDAIFQLVARFGRAKVDASLLKSGDKKSSMGLIDAVKLWNERNLNDPGWGSVRRQETGNDVGGPIGRTQRRLWRHLMAVSHAARLASKTLSGRPCFEPSLFGGCQDLTEPPRGP